MPTDCLIIGVGNSLRGDDGAGWVLAEQLAAQLSTILAASGAESDAAVQVRLVQQLLPELAAEMADLEPKVLVIADCAAGAKTARLQRIEQTAAGEPLDSHGLTAGQLLAFAVRLYEFSADAWLATVPGFNFAHGAGLSDATAAAIAAAAPAMSARLLALRQPAAQTPA